MNAKLYWIIISAVFSVELLILALYGWMKYGPSIYQDLLTFATLCF